MTLADAMACVIIPSLIPEVTSMAIDIKLQISLSLEEEDLEDALAEYDELAVSKLICQILDKSIALDAVAAQVLEGPDTLEDYDAAREAQG